MFISFASSLAMNIILALCIRNGEERKMKKVQQERGLGSYIIFLSSILCCKKKKKWNEILCLDAFNGGGMYANL